jgi:hypothetical protein
MKATTSSSPIAVFGDWHGDTGWALSALRAAAREGVRNALHVGDFGFDWPGAKRGRYESRLNRFLTDNDMLLTLVGGNHDCWSTLADLPVEDDGLATFRSNIKVLPRGGRTTIQGLKVGGLGGAFSVDYQYRTEGKDWWANEEPTAEEAHNLIRGGPLDVLITHDAPTGVPLKGDFVLTTDLVERAERTRVLLREVVDELAPPQVFCGHWHQRRIHHMVHSDGRITRIDVLDKEESREGNAVLLWPGREPLRIEPLFIRGD